MTFRVKLLLLIVIILAVVMPMFLKGPDGRPIMSWQDWLPDGESAHQALEKARVFKQSLATSSRAGASSDQQAEPVTPNIQSGPISPLSTLPGNQIYKWQDHSGRWHFSNQKPQNIDIVIVEALPEVKNVMSAPVTARKNSSTIGMPDGLSLENAGELLKKLGLSADQQESR